LATRARRGNSGPASGKSRRRKTEAEVPDKAVAVDFEEIGERAARLGITPERVLLEYAHIAFADLRHIVEWGPEGLVIKPLKEISPDDTAAIFEIVPGTGPGHSRVKLYDKKAALDAIARHLGMFPLPPRRREKGAPEAEGEDPREVLERRLARLAASIGEE
jgi:phage terminase small subunit